MCLGEKRLNVVELYVAVCMTFPLKSYPQIGTHPRE